MLFMHDLPGACGEGMADAVLDEPQSLAGTHAQHKRFSVMLLLEWWGVVVEVEG